MTTPRSCRELHPPTPSLSPWQALYGAAHRLRRRWYAVHQRQLPLPVLSVGNLHFGGSGKTPLTAAIAAWLRDRGWRIAILSRGYRSQGRGIRLVSVGHGPLLEPKVAGDEPTLLAEKLPGVAVIVGSDRYAAGVESLQRLQPPPQILVLDDGFSHLRLHRDLDLLAFPGADPFAGGRLLPSGRLREPLSSARHADAVIVTGTEQMALGPALATALRSYGFAGPGFTSDTVVRPPRLGDSTLQSGCPVLLVTGVARPDRVATSVTRAGFEIARHLAFPDHHDYPTASLGKIEDTWRQVEAVAILTTTKDHVKLAGRIGLPVACMEMDAVPEPEFFAWLNSSLARLKQSRTSSPGDG
jgi:tetraacyldisaccharide 4'-kinase